jgi:hypothetical protein
MINYISNVYIFVWVTLKAHDSQIEKRVVTWLLFSFTFGKATPNDII